MEHTDAADGKHLNFIEEIIEDDLARGRCSALLTRFPPEPNGYLHIGHAKSICLNFGLAQKYGGKTNLRFDDTNPSREDVEYVDAIKEDLRWLGFEWAGEYYASDYFERLYQWAVQLIRQGDAYVDDQLQEEIRLTRGTVTKAGTESPFRNRDTHENLRLFQEMKQGKYPDGSRVLRAKIDMSHPNMLLRDPVMYRILSSPHHRTGDAWHIYPMYDYAHGQSDSIEGITHSICTLEFDVHRPLYDWFIEKLGIFPSHQYEFARLNLTYTLMSKRKLLELVKEGIVSGWDDPRMPTICGLRRRGYTPQSIRMFAEKVGVAKRDNVIDLSLLEWCLREDLNRRSLRRFAVLRPLKVIITNLPDAYTEEMSAINNPEDASAGSRPLVFSREIYIEQDDYMDNPPKNYHRLSLGKEVRLKYAYVIKCEKVVRDDQGKPMELHCSCDLSTRSGAAGNRHVKGTIHWLSAAHCHQAQVRLFDRLFTEPLMDALPEDKDYRCFINPQSLQTITALVEPSVVSLRYDGTSNLPVQFERLGYFALDPDSADGKPIFNRAVTLRDGWAKAQGVS